MFSVREAEGAGPSDTDTVIRHLLGIKGASTQHISARPLGSVQGTDPQPMLVILRSQAEVFRVIGQRQNLPASTSVAPDRTRDQRELWRSLKAKVDECNAVQDNKVMVEYIDGVPTIVPDTRPRRPPGPPIYAPANGCGNNKSRIPKLRMNNNVGGLSVYYQNTQSLNK